MPDFAKLYATFRGSKAFLVGLISFVGIWMTIHFLTGFDRDWGMLNLFLSSEASISLAFFTMLSDKQDAAQAEMLEHLRRITEAILEVAQTQYAILKDHSSLLNGMRENDLQMLNALNELDKDSQ